MSSRTEQQLANINKAVDKGLMTADEARDERILVRLTGVADSRRARLSAPSR